MIKNASSPATKATKEATPAILFHADAADPDMLYFSRFNAFDPYMAFSVGGKKFAVAPGMEYGRMGKESAFDELLLLSEVRAGAAKRFKLPQGAGPDDCQVARHLAKVYGIREFRVGSRFPAGLAFQLRDAGIKVMPAKDGELFPDREIKTTAEVAALRKGNRASAAGMRVVSQTLEESKIRNGKLIHGGRVLTSERLRELISQAALAEGAVALHTIAAGGDQACDCHNAGEGPIRPNELIVVDIFPRRPEDGYWGDMTRTFLKGRASDTQRRMVRTVKRAHELGMKLIKPGVTGGSVQEAVDAFFVKEGYVTTREGRTLEGFFHSVGHGVGLEIHEKPFIRAGAPWVFREGMVVTVEPGLYYRGIGGVRIEDVVHVVPGGNERISSSPYRWEIP
jgi:Xaa-Pro aminopeptidase